MGLKSTEQNVSFLGLSEGKIVMRVSEATSTSVARKISKGKNEGQTVHEEKFNEISGLITSVTYEDKTVPFQKEPFSVINLIITDDGEVFKIEFPLSSTYAKSLVTRLEHINFEEEVVIKTHWIEGDDKKSRGYISIKQDGEKIGPAYTRDDLPGITPITNAKGKVLAYDDEDLMAFYKSVIDVVQPNFKTAKQEQKAVTKPAPKKPVTKPLTSNYEMIDDEIGDDTPFDDTPF